MATTTKQHEHRPELVPDVVVIAEDDLEAARRDERVSDLHREADEQLAELEAAGRVLT